METATCVQAFLISRLTAYATLDDPTLTYGIGLIVGLIFTEFSSSMGFSAYYGISNR